jgi:hypothetical protein
MPEGTIYVGRPSKWGNPYKVQPRWWTNHLGEAPFGPTEAVRAFRAHLLQMLTDPETRKLLAELRGHDLACWCRLDQPCHADILLELANRPLAQSQTPSQK